MVPVAECAQLGVGDDMSLKLSVMCLMRQRSTFELHSFGSVDVKLFLFSKEFGGLKVVISHVTPVVFGAERSACPPNLCSRAISCSVSLQKGWLDLVVWTVEG